MSSFGQHATRPSAEPRFRSRILTAVMLVIALSAGVFAVPPAQAAGGLDGVFHAPFGNDELYSSQLTERAPRDPMAGQAVRINATTWPIAPGQSVWVTWSRNGVEQSPVGAQFSYNTGNNSYWNIALGSFDRDDLITYSVNADVNGGGQKSTAPFSFATTSWSQVTNVTSVVDNGTSVDLVTGDSAGDFTPRVRYAFPRPDGFDTQIAPTGGGLTLVGTAPYQVSQNATTVTIATAGLQLKIQKSPYRLAVYQADGTTLITRQYDPAQFRNIGWASDGTSTVTKIEDHLLSPTGERFEGFGERYDRLDHRGSDVLNYVYNQYQDQGSSKRTYLAVPYFTNSAGYGIHVPSTRNAIFNLATSRSDMAGFTVDTSGALDSTLTYQFFTGTPAEMLNDYTASTVRPALPPKWAFGLWMSANEWNTQAKVEAEFAKVAQTEIPHTAIVLEQWSDEATFYLWKGANYTSKPGSEKFSSSDLSFPANGPWTDPKAMIDQAHEQGIKVLLWQIPVLKENFSTNPATAPQQHINDTAHATEQGFVAKNSDGTPYRIPSGQWFGDSLIPDYTSDAATQWWMSKRDYLVDEMGVDGFKTDGSEAVFGRDVQFADGRTGDEMHNAYPNEYTGAYADYVSDKVGSEGALFSRAGTSGAQGNSIFWAGDQASSFGAFQEAVRAGQSAGQSGIPFWSWDLAGFTGSFPTAELYLRSAAQATFSPVMQYHSEKADPAPSEARTPWNVQARTGDSSVVSTFAKFANVRMNLLPYTYTEASNSAATGAPMMQAMAYAYPGDSEAAARDQQYLFGRNLLVAPITTAGATTKELYLPAGEWYDLWNGGRALGGTKSYSAGLDTIPVYAKAGAVLPLNLNADYELGGTIGNSVNDYTNLTFRVYPSSVASSYGYFDDSAGATKQITQVADRVANTVTVGLPALETASTIQVSGTKPSGVSSGGAAVTPVASVTALWSASEGWFWDAEQQLTLVKTTAAASARTITLAGVDKAAHEAEFGVGTAVTTNTDHAGFTGTGFVDGFSTVGDSVEVDVWAETTASHSIVLRYANGSGSNATRTIYRNGIAVGTITLPPTATWDTWATASLPVSLTVGVQKITVGFATGNATGINLDSIGISR
ncbi:TIM-barrel domain-containing protein [Cryobacterium sp. Y50]|uniref:TIM-barrel domain-containing protein n=1 Tax=Cryobacterium sp. Y50 TaxID=2048286 RepID=UPI000CE36A9F|nr:TIM-barrel domain-containing protein [Cryobacterium sp. Y50]